MRRRTLTERALPLIPSSHVPLTVTCASSDPDAPPSAALADHHSRCLQRRRAPTALLPLTWCFVSFVTKDVAPRFFAFSFAGVFFFFSCGFFTFFRCSGAIRLVGRRSRRHLGRFHFTHGPLLDGLL